MKGYLKKALCMVCLLCIVLFSAACSNGKAVKPYRYNPKLKRNNIASVAAAENGKFKLVWDSETCLVSLVDKQGGKSYSNIPSSSEKAAEWDTSLDSVLKMLSPITVDCVRNETYEIKTGYAADCISKGDFSVSMIDNGIRVTYIFEQFKISVPVRYLLFEDGLKIEIEPSTIAEDGGKYFLHSIAVSPFLCSAKNMTKDAYLFYPSGSGVLVNMNAQKNISENYVCEIYGRDRMSDIPTWCDETNTEDIRMPVFGSVCANEGMFAIIDTGAELGSVCMDAFNQDIGYSAVYPEFAIRGETSVSNPFLSSSVNSKKYSDYFALGPISISYYPLKGENASYNGMADIYRNYLSDNGMTEKKNDHALSVKILGGAMINESKAGIPTRRLFATATLADAQNIVSDLTKTLGSKVNVDLVGYGKTGLEIGQICGGLTVAGAFGGVKGLKRAYQNMTDSGNQVFFDMDPISIAKSGKGFSTSKVAVTTTRQRFGENSYDMATGNKKKFLCYFIPRDLLPKAVEKSISALQKFEVNGIALDALSNYAYSDYSQQKYYSKGQMGKDVAAAIKRYQKHNISVLSNTPNVYSAIYSDLIVDAPIQSSKMDFFGEEVPFYQMVLQGYIPMGSPSLNLSNDSRKVLLKAAESGMGLSYTLIRNFTGKLRDEFDFYHNTCYDDIKDTIKQDYARIQDLHQSVGNQKIVRHTIVKKGIHKTVFSNGMTVYTNFGDSEYETTLGALKPYSFVFGKEETP